MSRRGLCRQKPVNVGKRADDHYGNMNRSLEYKEKVVNSDGVHPKIRLKEYCSAESDNKVKFNEFMRGSLEYSKLAGNESEKIACNDCNLTQCDKSKFDTTHTYKYSICDQTTTITDETELPDEISSDESGVYVSLRSDKSFSRKLIPDTEDHVSNANVINTKSGIFKKRIDIPRSTDLSVVSEHDTLNPHVDLSNFLIKEQTELSNFPSAFREPVYCSNHYQPYLRIDSLSDVESVASTGINRQEYFQKLKEFEHTIAFAKYRNMSGRSDVNPCKVSEQVPRLEPSKHILNLEKNGLLKSLIRNIDTCSPEVTAEKDTEKLEKKTHCELPTYLSESNIYQASRKDPYYGDEGSLVLDNPEPEELVSLEEVIQDFLQYFHEKRITKATNDKTCNLVESNESNCNNKPMENNKIPGVKEDNGQKIISLLDEENSHDEIGAQDRPVQENNAQDSTSNTTTEIPPSPPPRRPKSDCTRASSAACEKQDEAPLRKYDRSRSAETDNTQLSPRSPFIRKREVVMRRYNSTSVLPVVTPVDMNKNHIMESNDDSVFSTDCNSDNTVKKFKLVNGMRSSNGILSLNDTVQKQNHTESQLVHLDIVGDSFEARYPWQRDISIQCDIVGSRTSISSDSMSSESDVGSYSTTIKQQCNEYVNANCLNQTHGNPARRQSSDNVRRRHNLFKNRRPRSMTFIDTGNIYNSHSDMYRSDTNLNYRHGRTNSESSGLNSPNRKRMPLLLADDPGSVSDLESILENPLDSISDRNNSVGSDGTDLSTHLSRLEDIRDNISDTNRVGGQVDSAWNNPSVEGFRNVLHSPRVSPEMWSEVPEVIVNAERGGDEKDRSDSVSSKSWNSNLLTVPKKPSRRLSSGSLHSGSDESDNEISPPIARRGRRAAIVDTKNFGDVSPTQLSPEVSPSNSCDEGETGSNIAERLRRRRSSHDVSMNVYPGDLLVQEHHKKLIKRNTISDFYAGRNGSTATLADDSKKQRQPFSLLKLMKSRSKESLHLSDVLKKIKASEFKDNHLAAYKNVHWTDLIASTDKHSSVTECLNISETERKRRESVWELFKSECVFLIDHLMVLKHCFLEPLKKCQVEGFLMYTEPSEIFSNLDELCYVSYMFCKDFISSLLKDMSATDFGSTSVLIRAFQRFSKHSKDGSVYHTYCLNYTNALSYLEKLRKNDDFCEFEKWCEQDQRCNRLQLADLLIGPMQHCTKLPLLLHNIQKYTEDPVEKTQIIDSIEKVDNSLRQLEEKMKWLKNFERVQEIQRHLIWPSISDLDSRAFIPEYLRPRLSRQPCERLLACPSRQLLHEGAVILTETTKSFDAYMFLFDDILLITKIKKPNRKKQSSSDIYLPNGPPDNQNYTVYRQPIALDRLGIHDVMPQEATANGLKCAFVLVQISRFQQIIDVFTIQAHSETVKGSWISQILDAKARCCANTSRGNSLKENEDPGTGNHQRKRHGKSHSIDAVFL